MKSRILFLIKFFIVVLLIFAIQKPIFMLYNGATDMDISIKDYLLVMLNGLKLDSSMAGYLILLPLLIIILSIWYNKWSVRKILKPYYLIISFFIACIFIIDMSLYEFWNFKLDATILLYIDSPVNALASVPIGFIILRVIIALSLTFILYKIFVFITPSKLSDTKARVLGTVGLVILIGGVAVMIRGGISESTANIGRVYFSTNQFLNHSAVNPLFSYIYSLGKSENFAEQFVFFPEEERAEILNSLFPKGGETRQKVLNTEQPNILIILLESFSANIVESLGGETDITPNIDRLAREGIFFTNCYANSFRTDRGLVCILSGFPGLPTTSIMKMPIKSQSLPAIAHTLSTKGYKTSFLYGGDINFTNMQSYFRSTGYQELISDKDFSLKEQTNAWGVDDDITFEYLYNSIIKRTDKPWHTGFLTLSSHDPHVVPYNRLNNKVANAFAFTDECLGQFVDKLKQTSAWENMLIVCLPDHGSSYPSHLTVQSPDFFHIPMLWLGGAVKEPMTIETIMSQTDLAATLLGQIALPHDDFEYSRDVFSSSYTYPFAFSAFNNGFIFRDSTGVSVYDNNPDMPILEKPSPNNDRVEKGKVILQTLYDDLGRR